MASPVSRSKPTTKMAPPKNKGLLTPEVPVDDQVLADLRRSEEKFRSLSERAPNAIFVFQNGRLVYVNEGSLELVGYTPAELCDPAFDLRLLIPKERADLVDWDHHSGMFRQLAEGRSEHTVITRNGEQREVLVTTRVIDYENEMALLGTASDVTELRRLEQELVRISTYEQQRIGQELHDLVAQNLAGLNMMAKAVETSLQGKGLPEVEAMTQLRQALGRAQINVQSMIQVLRPVGIEPDGLMAALAALTESTVRLHDLECEFRCPQEVYANDSAVASHLFYIALEAVRNVVAHAQATKVVVELTGDNSRLNLRITDNGRGLPSTKNGGMGLKITQHRANVIGASLSVTSPADGGTVIICSLPMPAEARAS